MLPSKGPQLNIQLAQDEVYLRGGPNDGSSALTKGILKLTTEQSLQAYYLTLTLIGTIKTNWTTEGRMYRDKKQVLCKEWVFLTKVKKKEFPHAITKGTHHFPFQAVLDRDLPHSLDTKNGKVEYEFSATLGLAKWFNPTCKKILKVTRIELPSSPVVTEGIYTAGDCRDLFSYQLSCPNRAFGPNDPINLKFNLKPLKTNSKLVIHDISCIVKRTIGLQTQSREGDWVKKQKETILAFKHEPISQNTQVINKVLSLSIPSNQTSKWSKLQSFIPDTNNNLISIKHEVNAKVGFTDNFGKDCDMLMKFQIKLIPLDRDQLHMGLPTYNNRNTLLLDTSQLLPTYRPVWCPLANRPSISSLPSYEEPSPRFKSKSISFAPRPQTQNIRNDINSMYISQ